MFNVPVIDAKATGARISMLCEEKGISGNELAEYLYQTPQAVSKWKNGKSLPNITNIVALMMLFDKSFEDLVVYKGEDEMSSPSFILKVDFIKL